MFFFVRFADGRGDDASAVGADARAGRVRHGLRAGHRAVDGDADGHQLPAVLTGGHIHVTIRRQPRRPGVQRGGPVLPLQEPGTAAPRPGHERPVDHQPVYRAHRVWRVLPGGRVLRHQAEDDEQTAQEVTAVLQEVPARLIAVLQVSVANTPTRCTCPPPPPPPPSPTDR